MNQEERLLILLRQGPVSPLQAWIEMGIYRAADPVERLRKRGYSIDTKMKPFTTNRGYKVKFAEYWLIAEPNHKLTGAARPVGDG
jgi:hypothetical protein